MIVNKQNIKSLFKGFNTSYQRGFNGTQSHWNRVAMKTNSKSKGSNYGWLGEFPDLIEWIGERQVKNLAKHGFSIENKKFEATIGIGVDEIEDDEYADKAVIAEQMGVSAKRHPDKKVFGLLADGFTGLCYDGQYFFDNDHPVGETTVSNMQAGAENPWFLIDDTNAFKALIYQNRKPYDFKSMTSDDDEAVFMRDEFRFGVSARMNAGFGLWQLAFGSKAELTQANFDAAVAEMMLFESDTGNSLGVIPSLLVCGPSNRAKAKAVVEKENLAGGESNTNYKAVEVLIVPWLK